MKRIGRLIICEYGSSLQRHVCVWKSLPGLIAILNAINEEFNLVFDLFSFYLNIYINNVKPDFFIFFFLLCGSWIIMKV